MSWKQLCSLSVINLHSKFIVWFLENIYRFEDNFFTNFFPDYAASSVEEQYNSFISYILEHSYVLKEIPSGPKGSSLFPMINANEVLSFMYNAKHPIPDNGKDRNIHAARSADFAKSTWENYLRLNNTFLNLRKYYTIYADIDDSVFDNIFTSVELDFSDLNQGLDKEFVDKLTSKYGQRHSSPITLKNLKSAQRFSH